MLSEKNDVHKWGISLGRSEVCLEVMNTFFKIWYWHVGNKNLGVLKFDFFSWEFYICIKYGHIFRIFISRFPPISLQTFFLQYSYEYMCVSLYISLQTNTCIYVYIYMYTQTTMLSTVRAVHVYTGVGPFTIVYELHRQPYSSKINCSFSPRKYQLLITLQ